MLISNYNAGPSKNKTYKSSFNYLFKCQGLYHNFGWSFELLSNEKAVEIM